MTGQAVSMGFSNDEDLLLMLDYTDNMVELLRPSAETSTRIEGYVEETIPNYSIVDFQSHFRMTPSTFQVLCETLAPLCVRRQRTLTLEKQLLATLWIVANQESYRGVADRFGLGKGSLHRTVIATCNAIVKLVPQFVCFPSTRDKMVKLAEEFEVRCGFPGVVGAIDGTHIQIPGPKGSISSYINRKGYASMVLQVVCDSKLKFLDIFTGWPGSVHDARVYRNSPVSRLVESLPQPFHLLGDSAYPLTEHLLVPFRDNGHLTPTQKKFNKKHSSTRVEVERAIGLLKCRFRRLKYLDMKLDEQIPIVIASCCLLHNFILDHEGPVGDEELEDAGEIVTEPINSDGQSLDAISKCMQIALSFI